MPHAADVPAPLPARLRGPQRPLVVPPAPPGIPEPGGPVEGELLPALDEHGLIGTRHTWGAALACRCGRWEAAATGAASLRYAEGEHRRHVEQARTAGDA